LAAAAAAGGTPAAFPGAGGGVIRLGSGGWTAGPAFIPPRVGRTPSPPPVWRPLCHPAATPSRPSTPSPVSDARAPLPPAGGVGGGATAPSRGGWVWAPPWTAAAPHAHAPGPSVAGWPHGRPTAEAAGASSARSGVGDASRDDDGVPSVGADTDGGGGGGDETDSLESELDDGEDGAPSCALASASGRPSASTASVLAAAAAADGGGEDDHLYAVFRSAVAISSRAPVGGGGGGGGGGGVEVGGSAPGTQSTGAVHGGRRGVGGVRRPVRIFGNLHSPATSSSSLC